MSQLLGAALPQQTLQANDNTLRRIALSQSSGKGKGKGKGKGSGSKINFRSPWWPNSGFIGEGASDLSLGLCPRWDIPASTRGRNSRFGFMGVTRDVYNSPLPGATVKLFRTSDDTKVTPDVTSDAVTGEYVISTPYYEPHWLKIKKSGSPDVQGVSVDVIYPNV